MKTKERMAQYAFVPLTADLNSLTEKQRRMIPLLVEAAQAMDDVFWRQAYGHPEPLLASIQDPQLRRCVQINYGPWDRLRGNEVFLEGQAAKPPGAAFYPPDVTQEELEAAASARPELKSPYTMVRRSQGGELVAIPYREFFREPVRAAADKLREAAELAEEPGLRRYLKERAEALLTDNYQASDLAWMDMKDNALDVVIGPIETYEDQLLGYKAAHEGLVLIRDREWSMRLARYTKLLPRLQASLPVPEVYKHEVPGTEGDLNVYDAICFAGEANTIIPIAINLPNDEAVQLQKGTRALQLKNAMGAKFDHIGLPLAHELIIEDQHAYLSFDAYFENVMFHEIAHGLGIKNTITGRGRVREALKEQSATLEEAKADVLGLYMVKKLHEWGELGEKDLRHNYVVFLTSTVASIRFGAASAHGRANLMIFNFFKEMGAFTRDAARGRYRLNLDKVEQAINALSERILRFQGDGDYEGVVAFMERYGYMDRDLHGDLEGLASMGVPVDVVFEQGLGMLGL